MGQDNNNKHYHNIHVNHTKIRFLKVNSGKYDYSSKHRQYDFSSEYRPVFTFRMNTWFYAQKLHVNLSLFYTMILKRGFNCDAFTETESKYIDEDNQIVIPITAGPLLAKALV